jgi:uncharacterized protein
LKKVLVKLIIAVIVVFAVISLLAGFIIDVEWFKNMGYLSVFFTGLKAKLMIFIPSIVIIFAVIFLYTKYLRSNYNKMNNTIEEKSKLKKQNRVIAAVALVISVMMSISFTTSFWYQILEFVNGTSFNVKDPIFNLDVGFFVFKLPLISNVLSILITIVVMMIIVTLAFYGILKATTGVSQLIGFREFIRGSENPQIKFVAKQLAIFGAMLLLLFAGEFYIKMLNLVYSHRGVVFGAGYTDSNIALLMYKVIAVACVIAAVIVAYSIIRKKIRLIVLTSVFIVVLIVGEGIASGLVENLIVTPNAREKELPYITRNIEYTRKAFGLDKIVDKQFKVDNILEPKDLTEDKLTVDNIRINEFSQAQEVYNQLQAISNFYRFNDVDIDRYDINGKMQQTFIAARELDNSNRDAKFQTWQNKHLFYTHGYGAVMSPTNTVNASGLPNYILKDIPATGTSVKLDRPQIYYGEINDDYIIVNAKSNEIDYPSGTENKESRYTGTAGISLNMLNRWLLTINYGDMNFLLSNDITSNSKILLNRNIMNRITKIAPFIKYDSDPYLVVSEGKLYWIIDGITSTDRYPYSEPYGGINYIRNSVKVIVDAYNGDVNFYIADSTDAIAQTIGKIYTGLFKDFSKMPADLKKHLRYSEDTLMTQSLVYEKYHMTNSNVFYNSEDLWAVAKYKGTDGEDLTVEPVYQVMKLPGDTKEKFLLTIPFTVAKKENMISWLSAGVDNGVPGLNAIIFPKDTSVYGPQQFNSRLKTNTEISSLMTLLGQKGSTVLLGETNIIPIKNSLLYVKPFYLKADSGKTLPELKKVIVGFGDRTVMANSIQEAFQQLFNVNINGNQPTTGTTGTTGTTTTTGATKTTVELVNTAADLFTKAKDAQKAGDWAAYGEYQKQLEQIINQLKGTVK